MRFRRGIRRSDFESEFDLQNFIRKLEGTLNASGRLKKLLFGAAQGFNLQFLNLFGFSISVSFVWCII